MKKIAIIGGGSWGTALAIALSRSSRAHRLALWAHSADVVETLCSRRVNEIYLPGFALSPELEITGDLAKALAGAGIVLGVMPSAHARDIYRVIRELAAPGTLFVSATKGLEPATHARISEVIAEEMGRALAPGPFAPGISCPIQPLWPLGPATSAPTGQPGKIRLPALITSP